MAQLTMIEDLYARIDALLPPRRAALVHGLAAASYRLTPAHRLEALDVDATVASLDAALDVEGVRLTPHGDGTLVQYWLPDMPFLLSTMRAELDRLRLDPVDVIHPVFGARRDPEGRLQAILPARGAERVETYARLWLPVRLDADERAAVGERLAAVLADVRRATSDFPRMRARLGEVLYQTRASAGSRYGLDEVDEVIDLLSWLRDDRFIMLGYRDDEVALGIPVTEPPLAEDRLLAVARTARVATVYRQVPMVSVAVKRVHDGQIAGEFRLLGLYAQRALAEPASLIPVLRRKLQRIVRDEDLVEHSYDERAVRVLFDAFPKHELFEASAGDLARLFSEVLDTSQRRAPRVLLRGESALLAVPRERFSDHLARAVQRLLGGSASPYRLTMTDQDMALVHFRRDPAVAVDETSLQDQVVALTRTFRDDLEDALAARQGRRAAREVVDRWGSCLPAGYTDRTDVETALADLGELERLQPDAVTVTVRPGRFRLYRAGPPVEPSRVLPLLESLGLAVAEEVPYRLRGTPLGEVHIHDYAVRGPIGPGDGDRVARAALALWEGKAEPDSLNRLVLHAGLEWDDVVVLRAYRRYRRQLGTLYSEAYTNDALVEHPEVARALLGYFTTRDPDARAQVEDALRGVERLDQDRILRGFLNLVDATLKTNRWRDETPRSDALALKIDSGRVVGMPKPVPFVEVFVHSPDVEGIHLRGGPVARGGLRWSDRVEDFRTEVLGLMKAQMTKNAVIVPTGAKGGFVLPRGGPLQPGYETFVRALLDVTDDEDPYLVVAADRGTATLSDVANAISAEYGYWLGDAFASGGSHGYDHKAMGITAAGAWVAVQRHFRELGVDVQSEPVTVVGVGDMSGDVFGNGLQRSEAVRLVAAFNHRDIFCDPDPDPVAAYRERRRLFELPRSSWQNYDRSLISEGGGVWSRTAKAIPLSEPLRRLLGVGPEVGELSPPELIRAILGARVDLLFFGGIGTFVKASAETNADVGDRANDEIRVDATAVRARVIGEGANLGITQRGRVEYALRGGRCNTDAVDNSAGVDTSDREVNLKILIGDTLGAQERDDVLHAMQDDVGAAACRDVYLQTWAISQELALSPGGIDAYERLMADLQIDRAVEALPSTAEMDRRREAGAGLARPEVAVLLGNAKVHLAARLLDSPLPDQPYLEHTLRDYFPPLAVERFAGRLDRHRLRRELVATVVANDVLNRMGVTWVSRTADELGCRDFEAVSAYWAAREVAGADQLYRSVEALDEHIDPQLQMEIEHQVDELVDAFARTYIHHGEAGDIAVTVTRDRPAFHELEKAQRSGDGRSRSSHARLLLQRYDDLGVDPDVAQRVATLADLQPVPDVAAVARASGHPVAHVAEVFTRLAEALPLDLLRHRLHVVTPGGRWERWQHRGLLDELSELGRAAATRAIAERPDAVPEDVVAGFVEARAVPRARVQALLRQLQGPGDPDLHAIAVAVRALHDLL